MAKQIYNEGRVVGLSSYEIYLKQHYATNPDLTPATERQWLASSLAMGSSMLLKYGPDNDDSLHYVDIQLPSDSRLCAANTIVANLFTGKGNYADGSNWANRITDYGPLISNTVASSPNGEVGTTGTVPVQDFDTWKDSILTSLQGYIRIVDGLVIQPGTWTESQNQPPEKDLEPNLSQFPRIRLLINGAIQSEVEILLTGFTARTVISGTAMTDGSTGTEYPDYPSDGEFLGPAEYPWANKIVFSTPSAALNVLLTDKYSRKIPSNGAEVTVDDNTIIDMRTTNPGAYYETNHQDARVDIDVTDMSTIGEGSSVITVFQRSELYPPAIFGTYLTDIGDNWLNPLDVVAPGTVKMFPNGTEEELQDYENTFPGTHGIAKNDDGTLGVLDENGNLVSTADVTTELLDYENLDSTAYASQVIIKTGNKEAAALSMRNRAGSQYPLNNPPTAGHLTTKNDNIYWTALLEALVNDKDIDILGDRLKDFKSHLPDVESTGRLNLSGVAESVVGGAFTAGGRLKSGAIYIEFSNGMKLFISPTNPGTANANEGDIGIGWPET